MVKCVEENCEISASCNFETEKIPLYCSKHKKENMRIITINTCKEENCKKFPTYNFENEKTRLYCLEHKKSEMVDIVHKRCLSENCEKRPNFNYTNEKVGLYCRDHALENMVDTTHPKCNECKIVRLKNKKYKGFCLRCFMYKYPEEKVTKNYKIKENHMTDFIKNEYKEEKCVFDKGTGGCSQRRPDCYIDKYTHVIVIECDEHQHNMIEYTSCDNKRTMEIFQDFGNRPVVYIRFNPDKYMLNNKKVESCFKLHDVHGIPVINSKVEWKKRLNKLKETIDKWLIKIPEKEVTLEYLFFNN